MPTFLPDEPLFGQAPPQQNVGMIDQLRQNNIFNPQTNAPGAYDPNMYIDQGQPMPMETPAYDALSELLGQRPEYEGPGMLKKIAASMMSLNDPRLAMSLLNQPDPELVDWQNQVGVAQKTADLESRQQQRQATTATAGRRATTAEQRLDFDINKFEQALTPEDKQTLELEKIDRRSENVLEQIEARAVAARETGDLRHADTLDAIAERAREARVTAGTRGDESRKTVERREELYRDRPEKTTGASQLERGRRIDNNIREYMNRNPEDADWFEEDNDGNFTLSPAKMQKSGWFGTGPSEEQRSATFEADKTKRDEILEAIYGGGTQTLTPGTDVEPKADPLGIR